MFSYISSNNWEPKHFKSLPFASILLNEFTFIKQKLHACYLLEMKSWCDRFSVQSFRFEVQDDLWLARMLTQGNHNPIFYSKSLLVMSAFSIDWIGLSHQALTEWMLCAILVKTVDTWREPQSLSWELTLWHPRSINWPHYSKSARESRYTPGYHKLMHPFGRRK